MFHGGACPSLLSGLDSSTIRLCVLFESICDNIRLALGQKLNCPNLSQLLTHATEKVSAIYGGSIGSQLVLPFSSNFVFLFHAFPVYMCWLLPFPALFGLACFHYPPDESDYIQCFRCLVMQVGLSLPLFDALQSKHFVDIPGNLTVFSIAHKSLAPLFGR